MKRIPLTQGKFALVDDTDFEWLRQWKWCAHKEKNTFYAVRSEKRKQIRMHRVILPGCRVDHENGCGLDNQRHNLRPASTAQNGRNRRRNSNNTSGFKGVSRNIRGKPWRVDICINKQPIVVGRFFDKVEAAKAYDAAARRYFGEFAQCNFPL